MACSPSKPLPCTPTPLTHTPCFVPCERMWPGSHPWGGVNPNDGLLRHIAQPRASLSSWPPQPSGLGPPGPHWERPEVWLGYPNLSLPCVDTPSHPAMSCCAQASYSHLCWMQRAHHQRTVQLVADLWFLCNVQWAQRLSSVYVSSSEATAPHNGTKTLSITIKWVCVQGVKGKGVRGSEEVGGGACVSWMFRGMPRPDVGRWRLRAGGGWGGWGAVGLGQQRVGVCRIWENENWGAQAWMEDLFTNWMNTGVTAKSH